MDTFIPLIIGYLSYGLPPRVQPIPADQFTPIEQSVIFPPSKHMILVAGLDMATL